MEATEVSVYSFIYKFMCNGSQQISEPMINDNDEDEENKSQHLEIWLFVERAATSLWRRV